MNRFSRKKERFYYLKNIVLPICIFLFIFIFFLQGIHSISRITVAEQQKSLETALNRSIIHCYTVEGAYPESLEYLTEHYALTYDTDIFFVDYQPIASNIMPDITIIYKGSSEK